MMESHNPVMFQTTNQCIYIYPIDIHRLYIYILWDFYHPSSKIFGKYQPGPGSIFFVQVLGSKGSKSKGLVRDARVAQGSGTRISALHLAHAPGKTQGFLKGGNDGFPREMMWDFFRVFPWDVPENPRGNPLFSPGSVSVNFNRKRWRNSRVIVHSKCWGLYRTSSVRTSERPDRMLMLRARQRVPQFREKSENPCGFDFFHICNSWIFPSLC